MERAGYTKNQVGLPLYTADTDYGLLTIEGGDAFTMNSAFRDCTDRENYLSDGLCSPISYNDSDLILMQGTIWKPRKLLS